MWFFFCIVVAVLSAETRHFASSTRVFLRFLRLKTYLLQIIIIEKKKNQIETLKLCFHGRFSEGESHTSSKFQNSTSTGGGGSRFIKNDGQTLFYFFITIYINIRDLTNGH